MPRKKAAKISAFTLFDFCERYFTGVQYPDNWKDVRESVKTAINSGNAIAWCDRQHSAGRNTPLSTVYALIVARESEKFKLREEARRQVESYKGEEDEGTSRESGRAEKYPSRLSKDYQTNGKFDPVKYTLAHYGNIFM